MKFAITDNAPHFTVEGTRFVGSLDEAVEQAHRGGFGPTEAVFVCAERLGTRIVDLRDAVIGRLTDDASVDDAGGLVDEYAAALSDAQKIVDQVMHDLGQHIWIETDEAIPAEQVEAAYARVRARLAGTAS